MLLDALLLLRGDGSAPAVTATEAGSTSLTRDATTGKAVIQVKKTGKDGIPVVVLAAADTGTSTDKAAVVTIQAANELAFDVTHETVATFPSQLFSDTTAKFMVRRVHTQKRYLRSVITLSGSNGTFSRDYLIFVGTAAMNT